MNGPIEPPADLRDLGVMPMQMYAAWREAGFTPEQALHLLGQMIAAACAPRAES